MDRNQIQKIFDNTTRSRFVHEAVLLVENTSGDFSANFEYGRKKIDSPVLMASIEKLFTTTCILILAEQKRLSLDDCIMDYFDKTELDGLHIYKGKDYSNKLTISNLLFQTSGLPDWYEQGGTKRLVLQKDQNISFNKILTSTKALAPRFAPNLKRAYYSDINFDMLGKIIEKITQMPLEKAYENFIFAPIGLEKTYLPTNEKDFVPEVYNKNNVVHRPEFIKSCRGSGGSITTARELMLFLKAFIGGVFFSKDFFQKLSVYRKLQITMGPIHYGGGFMQIPLGTAQTLFFGKGELIGHSGSTGSFAFYYPHKDLYFVGDLNQMAKPSFPIRLVMKLAMAIKK